MTVAKTVDAELDRSLQLETLAIEANEAHEAAETMAQSALEFARTAGERLSVAKSLLPHGVWGSWLGSNFKGSQRTAQRYIRLAENWHALEANATRVSHLSVRKALELLQPEKEDEPEAAPSEAEPPAKHYFEHQIEVFDDERLTYAFQEHELTKDSIRLLMEINKRGMLQTYEMLWEHDDSAAKVRKAASQLVHLIKQNDSGQTDERTAELVEMVENGEAESVFDAHRIRQAEREEAAKPKLSDADRTIAERAAQDLVGYDKQVDPAGLAEVQRIALELSQGEGWDGLPPEQKQKAIQDRAGEEHAATIKSSRPKGKVEKDPEGEVTVKRGLLESLKRLARYAPIAQRQAHTSKWNDKL